VGKGHRGAGMGGGVRTLAHVHNFQIVVWVPFFSSKFITSQKVSYKEQTPPFLYEEENYQSKIEATLTYVPYYSHSTPKYFLLGFISCALLLGFTTSLAIFLCSVNFTVACSTPPVSSSASSPSVYSSGLLTSP
jgi:hypothetical protein